MTGWQKKPGLGPMLRRVTHSAKIMKQKIAIKIIAICSIKTNYAMHALVFTAT
jgi:hypothetical protein